MVAAVALASVVEDYEAAFRDAGFSPGVVLPSMLAALGAAEGQRPTLVVKVDARTTSIAILNADQLQLFRTLENTRGVTITGRAAGRGSLSLGRIFSGYVSFEHRKDLCGGTV